MSVGEICNREVICIQPHEDLADAVRLMRIHHVGDLVVVEESGGIRRPIGIVTDRDIVVRVMGQGLPLEDFAVEDVMTHDLTTALESDPVPETLRRMREKGVRRLPIVDTTNNLKGILTADDVIDLLAEEIGNLAQLIKNEYRREIRQTVPDKETVE